MLRTEPAIKPYMRALFVDRIDSGYLVVVVDNCRFRIYPPTFSCKYDSSALYTEVYEQARNDGVPTFDETLDILIECGAWTEHEQERYDSLVSEIKNMKIDLFNNYIRITTRNEIRKQIRRLEQEYNDIMSLRYSLLNYSCEGIAEQAKMELLVCNSAFDEQGRKFAGQVFPTSLVNAFNKELLQERQIRELAHTEPWCDIWRIRKSSGRIFRKWKNRDMSFEQYRIISWSTFYDSIYKSPECPPDEVIHDDDAIDGWAAKQMKERESDVKKKFGESLISDNPKIAGADEVFIVAKSQEEAQQIYAMNDGVGRAIQKRRMAQLARRGSMKYDEFEDVKFRKLTGG